MITQPACLILSAPFSGAPVLAAMLGRHPELRALPDLNLGLAPNVNELLYVFERSQGPIADGLLRSIAALMFESYADEGIAQARVWLEARRDWTTAQLQSALCAQAAPQGLVVHDAESVLRPIELLRLCEAAGAAPIVHLVRHPWSQGVMAADRLADRLYVAPDFKDHALTPPVMEPQLAWLRANLNIERWVQNTQPQRVLRLSWERLMAQPEATLAELLTGLGLSTDEASLAAMLEYELWEFWGYGPRSAPYGLDTEALEAIPDAVLDLAFAAPTLECALPWREDGGGFAPEVIRLAQSLGYT